MTIWPTLFQVFGLCWALVSIASLHGVSGSNVLTFFGDNCQFDGNAKCVQNSACVDERTCQCQTARGDGTIHCPDPLEQLVEVTGPDNNFQSWNSSLEAPLLLECRQRITEITIERPVDQRRCTFQIFGENGVFQERLLLTSMELHLKVEQNGQVTDEGAFRISPSSASSNNYIYEKRTKPTFSEEEAETFTELPDNELPNSGSGMGEFFDDEDESEDGSNPSTDDEDYTDTWSGPSSLGTDSQTDGVLFYGVDDNKVAVFTVPQCGMELRFRAAKPALIAEGLNPGMTIAIDQEESQVVFSDPDKYLAGSPTVDDNFYLRQQFGASQTEILLHVALEYAAVQGEDDQGETCRDTGFVYRAYCTTYSLKMNALRKCSNLLSDPTTRQCLRNSQVHHGPMHCFKRCVWISCQPTANVCSLFRGEFDSETCLSQEEKTNIFSNCPEVS